ncbi:MAG: hypothetical protein IKV17_04165 [Bacteroidaceae bacterium]|nr:hypothetical protein [Bacteroidaceae bacterium]
MKNTFYMASVFLFLLLCSCSNRETPFERTPNNAIAMSIVGEYDGTVTLYAGDTLPLAGRSLRTGLIVYDFPICNILQGNLKDTVLLHSIKENVVCCDLFLQYTDFVANDNAVVWEIPFSAMRMILGESDSLSLFYNASARYCDEQLEYIINITNVNITQNGKQKMLLDTTQELRLNLFKKAF